MRHAHNIEVLF